MTDGQFLSNNLKKSYILCLRIFSEEEDIITMQRLQVIGIVPNYVRVDIIVHHSPFMKHFTVTVTYPLAPPPPQQRLSLFLNTTFVNVQESILKEHNIHVSILDDKGEQVAAR